MCFRLKIVESLILEKERYINERYKKAYKSMPDKNLADMMAEGGDTKLLRNEINILEKERKFILDRRSSWIPKTIWNVIIPILVTLITTYFLYKFGLK